MTVRIYDFVPEKESSAFDRYEEFNEVPNIHQLEEDDTAARALLEHLGYDCDPHTDEDLEGIYGFIEAFTKTQGIKRYIQSNSGKEDMV